MPLPRVPVHRVSHRVSVSSAVRRPSLRALAVTATAAVALLTAGCGSDGEPESTGTTVGDSATTTDQGTTVDDSGTGAQATPTVAAPSVGASPVADAAGAVQFAGVTVGSALDLTAVPTVQSSSATPAAGLLVQDLVVGTGEAASTASTAQVHYAGVLYSDGTAFDSNFTDTDPQPFELARTVPGFAEGIGGTDGVEPMRTGGRRLMVFPAALGYGDGGQGPIPAGASLVFVVDLLALS